MNFSHFRFRRNAFFTHKTSMKVDTLFIFCLMGVQNVILHEIENVGNRKLATIE